MTAGPALRRQMADAGPGGAGAVAEGRPSTFRECPICGSDRIRFYDRVRDNNMQAYRGRLIVFRCAACDVFFLNPPPPPEVGRRFFARMYGGDGAPGHLYFTDAFKMDVARSRLQTIEEMRSAGRKLLDVGSGRGHFVRCATDAGWHAWGVELDERGCEYARSQLGVTNVFAGSAGDSRLPDDFDVATLWDVIEHVPDPVDLLGQTRSRLAPHGLVFIRTANIRSWAFDRDRRAWWAFGADHRFYFSPSSLRRAIERCGFELVDILNHEVRETRTKPSSPDISETPLVSGLRSLAAAPGKAAGLGRYAVNLARRRLGPLRYGPHYHTSIMTVVARRTDGPGPDGGTGAQER